ncbi:MAG: alpha/beta fold hydrolase [Gemmatimonadota bacterium]|nr:alpha/beta fold hydrolase [Gemmatimonadota bacterium]
MSPTPVAASVTSERAISGGTRIALALHDGDRVPAILLLPRQTSADARAPAALLLHGYTSRKEAMSDGLGRALLACGVASLAIDLPMHGERDTPIESLTLRNPFELVRQWRSALEDARLSLQYLSERPEVDAARLGLVGYSLGSFLGVIVAAGEPRVRAVTLAAGGDLPDTSSFGRLIRTAADPLKAVRKLAGRPLLMVNGKRDRTVTPAQAERLFAAAGEPKAIRWWDTGHHLSPAAIADGAQWLATALGATLQQQSG